MSYYQLQEVAHLATSWAGVFPALLARVTFQKASVKEVKIFAVMAAIDQWGNTVEQLMGSITLRASLSRIIAENPYSYGHFNG